ncbi:unnamed protein product [Allacma fusca]|uniref:Proline-rich transmembrane protein 3/4 domain-containing protein n=1 Tax=Allacma fusca TaxID=39272 RepID=A0A8J2KMM4_9HEXA|nr:unnamed protein product [Allacma fusca]
MFPGSVNFSRVEDGLGHSDSYLFEEETLNCSSTRLPNNAEYYLPHWKDVHSNVRWVFLLHNYGFACLFFFLAFYAFFSILNLRSQLSTRPYMSTINSFLCLLGVSRAAGLFIDPYGLMKIMPAFMGALLWDLGFPCLISSFSLIQIAFLQLTQLDIGPEKFRKKTCLSVIITVHFVTVIASAIYATFNADLMQVKLVTQLVFALWGLLLCGSFLYAGKRVLGVIGNPGGSASVEGSSVASGSDKGLVGMGMGLLAPGQNIAASLTAALAPTLLHANTPKIKITDENDRTISVASDSSRLNDNVEAGSSGQQSTRPLTPVPGPSASKSLPSSSSVGNNGPASPPGESSANGSNYVRPPSPVLPRRKSAGQALRTTSCPTTATPTPVAASVSSARRISFNRRGSGYVDEKDAHRKKSLTWSESEVCNSSSSEKGGGHSKKLNKLSASDKLAAVSAAAADTNVASDGGKRRQLRKSIENPDIGFGGTDRNGGAATESLLSGGGPDYTLQSILSHIAYVNQTALDYRLSRKLSRKNQVHKVIKFTSITAILGVLLCLAEMIRILSPYGLVASSSRPSLWPWFVLQTVSRSIEFAMGATVANITKQPVNRPHHYAYSIRHKTHRESLYL